MEKVRWVDHITTYSELILALVGLLTATWMGMKKLYRMARNVEELVSMSHKNDRRLAEIEAQVRLNGGSSMRDAIHRIEDRLTSIEHLPCHVKLLNDQEREAL
jgi:hypothetical protein